MLARAMIVAALRSSRYTASFSLTPSLRSMARMSRWVLGNPDSLDSSPRMSDCKVMRRRSTVPILSAR